MNRELIKSSIIKQCGTPRDFAFLSRNSSGLDPIVLSDLLQELVVSKDLRHSNGLWVAKHHRFNVTEDSKDRLVMPYSFKGIDALIPFYSIFKKPHPLDYEWRNSAGTLSFLNDYVQERNQKQDRVLLLGMPSLFISAYYNKMPQEFVLIDRNGPLLEDIRKTVEKNGRFKIVEEDIFTIDTKQIGNFHSVFIDPPWYSNHYLHFMWTAAQCLEVGGYLGVSFPPVNTRPGIEKEKVDLINYCEQQGLYLELIQSNRLEYVMPFFEFNALRTAGIKDIQPFWRLGDFAVFRKMKDVDEERPNDERTPESWTEIDIKGVRIRINEQVIQTPNEEFVNHLIKGDILPTVSSRDSRRINANVWTSGNRIFQAKKPPEFITYTHMYKKSDKSPLKDYKIVSELLDYIVDIETKEYQNYIDWIQNEMERPIT